MKTLFLGLVLAISSSAAFAATSTSDLNRYRCVEIRQDGTEGYSQVILALGEDRALEIFAPVPDESLPLFKTKGGCGETTRSAVIQNCLVKDVVCR